MVSFSKLTTTYLSRKSIKIKLTFKDGKPVPDYDFALILTKGEKTKYIIQAPIPKEYITLKPQR